MSSDYCPSASLGAAMASASTAGMRLLLRGRSASSVAWLKGHHSAAPARLRFRALAQRFAASDDSSAGKAPYSGKHAIEGNVLPIAEDEDLDAGATMTIEERLQRRLKRKQSSLGLESTQEVGADTSNPVDVQEDPSAKYQVTQRQDHNEHFQDMFRRLRRTGRDPNDERDAGAAMQRVLEYQKGRKK
eukprot:gnl/TRDRNA2_/TRDRNA2_194091_c0_seq1.p1 gnl/TRDRNA2_/TRDRNA2_194091_c0~~gnl/TRDRNA2_/TRDRNA2_194091_c0_seq1.p1  ORF type:complete len:188 (-),score=35.64 gnl/TRDRNA2_/TRDRNA2_194091_c0_seq1:116-679(-)